MLPPGEWGDEGERMYNSCPEEREGKKWWKYRCVCLCVCGYEPSLFLQNRGKNIQYMVLVGFFLGISLIPMISSLRQVGREGEEEEEKKN